MGTIAGIIMSTIAFFIGAKLIKGIKLESLKLAFIVALVIALLNGTLGLVMDITIAGILTSVTQGFFQFVMDAIIIVVAGMVLKDFQVKDFFSALKLALIVAIMHAVAFYYFQAKG